MVWVGLDDGGIVIEGYNLVLGLVWKRKKVQVRWTEKNLFNYC